MCSTANTTANTDAQPDQQLESENNDDSDGMQSCQAESENEPSELKVKGTGDNVLLDSFSTGSASFGNRSSSGGDGYIADFSSAWDDQAFDQSYHCAARGQKQRSTMKSALNLLDLNYTSSEMESSSVQGGSSLSDEAAEAGTTSSASKAKASSSSTAKRSLSCNNLSSTVQAKNNQEATISASASAAAAPDLSSVNKQNRRHHSPNYRRRRSWPRPRARDRARDSPNNSLNALLSDISHKAMANTPTFDGTQAIPQYKGALISHPMDPRIDISTVGHVQAPVLALTSKTFVATTSPSVDLPSMETYTQLLSVS
jgi:hypothetical protein